MSDHASPIRLTLPEIDRLVAERVMGWQIHPRNTAHWMRASDDLIGYRPMAWHDQWHPTTDITHAWRVVERVMDPRVRGAGCFTAGTHFLRWWREAHICCDPATDAALKISLAALIAVGVEVEVADG